MKYLINEENKTEVPVSVVDLAEKKEKALNIALNKVSGDFHIAKLKEILVDLDDGENLELTGFSESELKDLIDFNGYGSEGLTDDDAVPETQKEVRSKPGDVYILGNHRLMCGDSTNPMDVKKLMDGQLADMVFTDPPYGVSIGAKNRFLNSFQKAGRNLTDIKDDELSSMELYAILLSAFKNIKDVLAECSSIFVCSPQGGGLCMMMTMLKDAGLEARHVLIWKKNSPTFSMGRLDYDYQHEPILFTWNKNHKFYGLGEHKTSVWEFDKPMASKLHPTMKPVALVENAILNNSTDNDIVGDFFGGSGTTLIACEKRNRKCRMMEFDPTYCDVIVDRWEKFTGNKAVLVTNDALKREESVNG